MVKILVPPFAQSRYTHSPLIYGGGIRKAAGGGGLVQQDSATSTAQTITGPAGIQSGDLLVLLDRAIDSQGVPTLAVPEGFTSIVDTDNGASTRQIASYKIADGSEASASLSGMTGDLVIRKVLVTFRGDEAVASITPSTPNEEQTTGDPSSQSVTASGGTPPLIVFGCYGAGIALDPRTFSPAKDDEVAATDNLLYLAWRIDNSSPQDTSIDMEDEPGVNILQSFYLAVA